MTFVFNYSLITGVFPDRLKYAIILPIHKEGDKLIGLSLYYYLAQRYWKQ
jgi:hypothetical protein